MRQLGPLSVVKSRPAGHRKDSTTRTRRTIGLLLAATCLTVLFPAAGLAQSVPSVSSRMFDNEKTDSTTPSVNFLSAVVPSSHTRRVIDSGATSATDIDPVDLDKDGDIDVVTAAFGSDQFAWHENDGSTPPVWTLRVIDNNVADTNGANDIEAADVDGDGDIDVVTAANLPDLFAWYENDGSTPPVWTLRVIDNTVANTDGANDVEAVDLDRDGDIDVLTAAASSNQCAWYENDGSTPPVWTYRLIDNSITNPRDIEAADVDDDGDIDVVVAASGSDEFVWYENDGSTPPVWTQRVIDNTVANADYAQSIDPVDLDGDGDIDVVTAAGVSDQFAWYENDGSSPPVWTLRVIDDTAANADGARRIHAVDFDDDGDTDVVTAAVIPDQFAWYENDGSTPPVWTLHVIDNNATNTDGANDIDPVDLDGDGDMDVVTSAQQTNSFAWYETGDTEVLQYEVQWDTVRGFIAADPAIESRRSWADDRLHEPRRRSGRRPLHEREHHPVHLPGGGAHRRPDLLVARPLPSLRHAGAVGLVDAPDLHRRHRPDGRLRMAPDHLPAVRQRHAHRRHHRPGEPHAARHRQRRANAEAPTTSTRWTSTATATPTW